APNATSRLRVFVRTDDVSVAVNMLSNGIVFDGTWHHVVYVDVSGRVQIWIDGLLDTEFDYSRWSFGPRSSLRGSYTLINSVTLGAVVRNQTVATPLAGMIDDLRIHRCALTAADIATIMQNGTPMLCGASIGEYGHGCGRGPLDVAATGSAAFGGTVHVQLFRGEPGSLGLISVGTGPVQPLDLSPLGFFGCTLYQPSLTTFAIGALGPAGSSAPISLPVPTATTMACRIVGFQGVTVRPGGAEFAPVALAQIGF